MGQTSDGGSPTSGASTSTTKGTGSSGSMSDGAGGGGAGDSSESHGSLQFEGSPTFTGNENPFVPQVGILRARTSVPAKLTIEVAGGGEEWKLDISESTEFEQPILGLKPETEYEVNVVASSGNKERTYGPLAWTTPPLTTDFPEMEVKRSDPSMMEPGMTLLNARGAVNNSPMLIVDHAGTVRWYYRNPDFPIGEDFRRLPNGNFLFNGARCRIIEIDVLGNIVQMWHAALYPRGCEKAPEDSVPVPVESFHHEISLLPDGNFLSLSTEIRIVDDFPTSDRDPDAPREAANVLGAVIIEFSRSGELVKSTSLMDVLEVSRIGRGSLGTSWSGHYTAKGVQAYDWCHANAVVYDEESDAYYVSLRHQDAVVAIRRTDGGLMWILGTPSNWSAPWSEKLLTPLGSLEWQYHQHAIEVTPLGLALYDNGNYRAAAFEPEQDEYSRAVIYSVNEDDMTVEQVWSYGDAAGDGSFFSNAMGEADWQSSTGNVLIVNGAVDGAYGQLVEVTEDGQSVFDLILPDAQVYRAQRLPDIRELH